MLFLYLIMFLLGVGVGVLSPTANNACIELLPDRAATITGIRGMFRQMGGALSVTIATLVVETVGDPSRGFAIVFFGLAIAFIAAVPFDLHDAKQARRGRRTKRMFLKAPKTNCERTCSMIIPTKDFTPPMQGLREMQPLNLWLQRESGL